MMLTNSDIAEFLALRGESAEGERQRIYRRAARAALAWPDEAAELLEQGRDLQELYMVGPRLARRIAEWIEAGVRPEEPPSSRRGFIGFAEARRIAHDANAVLGDLQMHSDYSDGTESVEVMARSAAALGHRYIAITDHSQGLKIARGMSVARLESQLRALPAVNERLASDGLGLRVLAGLEMNLDLRGNGDMPDGAIAGLDVVLGSFHSALRDTGDQTGRYLKAVANPRVDVLGHPSNRKYGLRPGLRADWDSVFAAAADHRVALEINAYPDRQDLPIQLLRVARNYDLYFSIGTDAHAPWELRFVTVGVAAAMTAGIPQERILNFWPVERVRRWMADRRT